MSTALSKAEQNAMAVSYDIHGTHVELDLNFVKRYLVKGNPGAVSNEEVMSFMATCKANNLNPLVSGEVYLIKYKVDQPAQMVVGYFAYLCRADKYPDYRGFTAGVLVMYRDAKGNTLTDSSGIPIVKKKEGAAVYKTLGEVLVGGWCEVLRERSPGNVERHYMEVALDEYNTGMSNWKTKPATMLRKVAVSQAFRAAFPNEYDGLYTVDEMVAAGAIPVEYADVDEESPTRSKPEPPVVEAIPLATKKEKMAMFALAKDAFGDDANDIVLSVLNSMGYENTSTLTSAEVEKVVEELKAIAEQDKPAEEEEDEGVPPWGEDEAE